MADTLNLDSFVKKYTDQQLAQNRYIDDPAKQWTAEKVQSSLLDQSGNLKKLGDIDSGLGVTSDIDYYKLAYGGLPITESGMFYFQDDRGDYRFRDYSQQFGGGQSFSSLDQATKDSISSNIE